MLRMLIRKLVACILLNRTSHSLHSSPDTYQTYTDATPTGLDFGGTRIYTDAVPTGLKSRQ